MDNLMKNETIREFYDRNYDDGFEGVDLIQYIDTDVVHKLVAIKSEATPYMFEDEDGDLFTEILRKSQYYDDDYEMEDVYNDIMIESKKLINEIVNEVIKDISDDIDSYGECIANRYGNDVKYKVAMEFEEELEIDYEYSKLFDYIVITSINNKHFEYVE